MIMKKMMIAALMTVAVSTAWAGDSDALKKIMKAGSYAEAESMIKSSLSALANDAEKAKAYNKLVDLAMKGVSKEMNVITSNQMAEQLGQGKVEQYDTLSFYTSLSQAFAAAKECEKYDILPNAKGKVAPKFHKSNQERLFGLRSHLINAGIWYQDKGDLKKAQEYLGNYVDSYSEGLYKELAEKTPDENLTNIAYYAAVFAFQNHDIESCGRYADIAKKDPEKAKDANNLKLAVVQESLKTRADSLNYVTTLEGQYANDPNDEIVFGTLVGMYSGLGMNDKMESLFDKKLATDPDNFTVWAIRGQNFMIAQDLKNAIDCFKKALKTQPENPQILTFLGACLLDRGSEAENNAAGKSGRVSQAAMDQIRPLYEESKTALEKAKELDPDQASTRWAYPLYRCYYQLYGADDARTKAAEALANGK